MNVQADMTGSAFSSVVAPLRLVAMSLAILMATPSRSQAEESPVEAFPFATAADIQRGAGVYDPSGALVGTVDTMDDDTVTLTTDRYSVVVLTDSLHRNSLGLVIDATAKSLDAAIDASVKTAPAAEQTSPHQP